MHTRHLPQDLRSRNLFLMFPQCEMCEITSKFGQKSVRTNVDQLLLANPIFVFFKRSSFALPVQQTPWNQRSIGKQPSMFNLCLHNCFLALDHDESSCISSWSWRQCTVAYPLVFQEAIWCDVDQEKDHVRCWLLAGSFICSTGDHMVACVWVCPVTIVAWESSLLVHLPL